jgi:signal peptide peptidase SppA
VSKVFLNLGHILSTKWMIHARFAEAYYPLVLNMLDQVPAIEKEDSIPSQFGSNQNSSLFYISEFGIDANPDNAPEGSIAVMSISGVITKYDQFCGNAGMLTKAALFDKAMANPNINGVILSFDTGGGDGMATELFSTKIKNATKPVVAYINGTAASAGYWLASSAEHIVIDGQTSEVGSIGTYVTIRDFKDRLKAMGITERRIYAPASKLKNKAYEDALKGEDTAMLEDLTTFNSFFIEAVKANRTTKLSNNKEIFQGAMFYANDALANGLVDQIGTFDDAVSYINSKSDSNPQKIQTNFNSNNMKKLMIAARFTSLLAFFGAKVDSGKESAEVEVSEEKMEELNSLASKVSQLETDLKTANDAKATAEASLKTAQDDLVKANNQIKELGTQAGQLGEEGNGRGAEGASGKKESISIPAPEVDSEFKYDY